MVTESHYAYLHLLLPKGLKGILDMRKRTTVSCTRCLNTYVKTLKRIFLPLGREAISIFVLSVRCYAFKLLLHIWI